DKVLEFLAPESDWLDIRYCAEDDDDTFYRLLPDADVMWHVLRPLSRADLERAAQCRLVHKLGSGVSQHHRRRRRDPTGHRGGQHAGRERAVGGRGRRAAHAGRAAATDPAGPRHPRRQGTPAPATTATPTGDRYPDLLALSDIVSLHLPLTER